MKRAECTQGSIGLRFLISLWKAHNSLNGRNRVFMRTHDEHRPSVEMAELGLRVTEGCSLLLSVDLTLHCLFELVGVNQMQYSSNRGSHVPMSRSGRGPTGLTLTLPFCGTSQGQESPLMQPHSVLPFLYMELLAHSINVRTIVISASNMLCSNNK